MRSPVRETYRENGASSPLAVVEVRIPENGAFGADRMRELELRAIPDVGLDLLPFVAFLNFLAGGADGENAGKSFHAGESLLQLGDQLVLSGFGLLALADVAPVDDYALDRGVIQEIVGHNFERDPCAVRMFGAVFRVNQFEPYRTNHLLLLVPHDVMDRGTGIADAAGGIANGKNVVAILHHLPEVVVQLA